MVGFTADEEAPDVDKSIDVDITAKGNVPVGLHKSIVPKTNEIVLHEKNDSHKGSILVKNDVT